MRFNKWVNYLRQKWLFLKGNDVDFTNTQQIYHSFIIVAIIAFIIIAPFDFCIDFKTSAVLDIFIATLLSFVLCLSRFLKKTNTSIFASFVFLNSMLVANYFINGGINGPTLLVSASVVFMFLMILPKNKMFLAFIVNLLVIFTLLVLEYYYPSYIGGFFKEKILLLSNYFTVYVFNSVFLLVGISYVRNSYDKEKKIAYQKTVSLLKLNNQKDKLFSIISHDLKTPLASIQQYLDLLTQMELDTEERKWIEANLLKATNNTQELLTNILQWSKTQMEGPEINLTAVNLKHTITKALEAVKVTAETKNITINTLIDDEIIVTADSNMLQLVLRNLLHNALKFTHKSGKVDIVASILANECLISITDNGVGMDKAAQDLIFGLNIASTYGTENETGTGLGLVLCKEYTQLQGGKIWFSSQKNVGTVFNFSLPLVV